MVLSAVPTAEAGQGPRGQQRLGLSHGPAVRQSQFWADTPTAACSAPPLRLAQALRLSFSSDPETPPTESLSPSPGSSEWWALSKEKGDGPPGQNIIRGYCPGSVQGHLSP